MRVSVESVPIIIPPPKVARSQGVHVSGIIRCIATETGILKPEWAEELSLADHCGHIVEATVYHEGEADHDDSIQAGRNIDDFFERFERGIQQSCLVKKVSAGVSSRQAELGEDDQSGFFNLGCRYRQQDYFLGGFFNATEVNDGADCGYPQKAKRFFK